MLSLDTVFRIEVTLQLLGVIVVLWKLSSAKENLFIQGHAPFPQTAQIQWLVDDGELNLPIFLYSRQGNLKGPTPDLHKGSTASLSPQLNSPLHQSYSLYFPRGVGWGGTLPWICTQISIFKSLSKSSLRLRENWNRH